METNERVLEPSRPDNKVKVEESILNVGESFLKWAEDFWAFEQTFTKGLTSDGGESCPYPYIRRMFVDKINELNGGPIHKTTYTIPIGSDKKWWEFWKSNTHKIYVK
jgi:hypothetical protein